MIKSGELSPLYRIAIPVALLGTIAGCGSNGGDTDSAADATPAATSTAQPSAEATPTTSSEEYKQIYGEAGAWLLDLENIENIRQITQPGISSTGEVEVQDGSTSPSVRNYDELEERQSELLEVGDWASPFFVEDPKSTPQLLINADTMETFVKAATGDQGAINELLVERCILPEEANMQANYARRMQSIYTMAADAAISDEFSDEYTFRAKWMGYSFDLLARYAAIDTTTLSLDCPEILKPGKEVDLFGAPLYGQTLDIQAIRSWSDSNLAIAGGLNVGPGSQEAFDPSSYWNNVVLTDRSAEFFWVVDDLSERDPIAYLVANNSNGNVYTDPKVTRSEDFLTFVMNGNVVVVWNELSQSVFQSTLDSSNGELFAQPLITTGTNASSEPINLAAFSIEKLLKSPEITDAAIAAIVHTAAVQNYAITGNNLDLFRNLQIQTN